MPSFGREILGNLPHASKLEWLVTNGIGGFATSTILGMNTRRYHGILISARHPPVERIVMVSRVEETLVIGGEEFPLSTQQYKNAIHPTGYLLLEKFERTPIPTWTYQIKDILLTKSICMVYGQNTTLVTYKVFSNNQNVELRVRPHYLFRDFHGNTFENPGFEDNTSLSESAFSLQPFGNAPTLHVHWDRGTFVLDPHWYREIFLQVEADRGLNPMEDDYSNGYLKIPLLSGSAALLFSDQPYSSFNPIDLRKREELRLESIASSMKSDDVFLRKLLTAADQFIVDRKSTGGKTIIAGYPWFSDWGRDALISLPGLTLVPGRSEDARSILKTFAESVSNGLIPNCFADQGSEALYNSVDASMWFFLAIYKFIEYTDDYIFVKENLFSAMNSIIESFQLGTDFHIKMDPDDGLISAGEEGIQLTWMDAKVDNWVVTPRHGKAVEVNALWYNALKIHELLQVKFDFDSKETAALARKVKISFKKKFYDTERKRLHDRILPDGTVDSSLRPNQIFAVFPPFSTLEPYQEKHVVEAVFKYLYTSFGLRSLSANDPAYHGKYQGDRLRRDGAYHQGTVWAYLIGPFITSFLKVHNYSMEAQLRASHMIEPFKNHLDNDGCVGSISEIFDGAPPHRAAGCCAQAWSVAELLRCYVEDIKGQKPTLIV